MTIVDTKRRWCVYSHSTPQTGVFYIGKGSMGRPLDPSGRGAAGKSIVEANNGVFEASIIEQFANEDDAFDLEVKLITELRPKGNLVLYRARRLLTTHEQEQA